MTSDEADQRISLSRNTLSRFDGMVAAGVDPAPGTLLLVSDEIAALEAIAEAYPLKVQAIDKLVAGWRTITDRLKRRLN